MIYFCFATGLISLRPIGLFHRENWRPKFAVSWGPRHIKTRRSNTNSFTSAFFHYVVLTNEQNIETIDNFVNKLLTPRDIPLNGSPDCLKTRWNSRAKISIVGQKSELKFISKKRSFFVWKGSKAKPAGIRLYVKWREARFGHNGTLFTNITF